MVWFEIILEIIFQFC